MRYLFLLVLTAGLVGCTTVYVGSQNSGAAPEVPRVVRVESVPARPVVIETQPVVLETQPVVLEAQPVQVVERCVQPVRVCRIQGATQTCTVQQQPVQGCAAPAAATPVKKANGQDCACGEADVIHTVKTQE